MSRKKFDIQLPDEIEVGVVPPKALARNYANDPSTAARDMSDAIAALFQSAPYSKRSYIRSFALLKAVGADLAKIIPQRFPARLA